MMSRRSRCAKFALTRQSRTKRFSSPATLATSFTETVPSNGLSQKQNVPFVDMASMRWSRMKTTTQKGTRIKRSSSTSSRMKSFRKCSTAWTPITGRTSLSKFSQPLPSTTIWIECGWTQFLVWPYLLMARMPPPQSLHRIAAISVTTIQMQLFLRGSESSIGGQISLSTLDIHTTT